MKTVDFLKQHELVITVHFSERTQNYIASIENASIRSAGYHCTCIGIGTNVEEAVADYVRKISNNILIFPDSATPLNSHMLVVPELT